MQVRQIGDISAKDFCRLKCVQRGGRQRGRNKPAFAAVVACGRRGPSEISASFEDYQEFEVFARRIKRELFGKFNALGGEIAASSEERAVHAGFSYGKGSHFGAFRWVKRKYVQRFLDVEFARIAMGIHAAVIVDAIGKVGIFLDFEDDHIRTDGVRCARRDKKSVACVDRMGSE